MRIFTAPNHNTGLKELGTIELEDYLVRTIQYVPGLNGGVASTTAALMKDPLVADLVWVGTDSQK